MSDNHTELCQRLLFDPETTDADAVDAAYVIKEQAARIQQQALEYVSLQAQCDEHLARIAELEKERDALKADAERYRLLRDFGKDGVKLTPPCEHVHALLYSHPVGAIPASRVITGDELDRAIEAAMEKSDARS